MRAFLAAVLVVFAFSNSVMAAGQAKAGATGSKSAKSAKASHKKKSNSGWALLSGEQIFKLPPAAQAKYMKMVRQMIVDLESGAAGKKAQWEWENQKHKFSYLSIFMSEALAEDAAAAGPKNCANGGKSWIWGGVKCECKGKVCLRPETTLANSDLTLAECNRQNNKQPSTKFLKSGAAYFICGTAFGYVANGESRSQVCVEYTTPGATSLACFKAANERSASFQGITQKQKTDAIADANTFNGIVKDQCTGTIPAEHICNRWKSRATELAKEMEANGALSEPPAAVVATAEPATPADAAGAPLTPEAAEASKGAGPSEAPVPEKVDAATSPAAAPGGPEEKSDDLGPAKDFEDNKKNVGQPDPNCPMDWTGTSEKVPWQDGGKEIKKPKMEVKCLGKCGGKYQYMVRHWDNKNRDELVVNTISVDAGRFGIGPNQINDFDKYLNGDFKKEAEAQIKKEPRCQFAASEARHNKELVYLYEKYLEAGSTLENYKKQVKDGTDAKEVNLSRCATEQKELKAGLEYNKGQENLDWNEKKDPRTLETSKEVNESGTGYNVKFGGIRGAKSLYVETVDPSHVAKANSVECSGSPEHLKPLRGVFFNYLNNRMSKAAGDRCPKSWTGGVCSEKYVWGKTTEWGASDGEIGSDGKTE